MTGYNEMVTGTACVIRWLVNVGCITGQLTYDGEQV